MMSGLLSVDGGAQVGEDVRETRPARDHLQGSLCCSEKGVRRHLERAEAIPIQLDRAVRFDARFCATHAPRYGRRCAQRLPKILLDTIAFHSGRLGKTIASAGC